MQNYRQNESELKYRSPYMSAPPKSPVSQAGGSAPQQQATRYCQFCGKQIAADAVLCIHCGRQVQQLQQTPPTVVIQNQNYSQNTQPPYQYQPYAPGKNKWVALLLCFFLGVLGAHKFYEGKMLLGVVYLFTLGIFGIGVFIDLIILLFKPNPYYV